MFSLSGLFTTIAGPLIDKLIGPFLQLAQAYLNKQITMEQLREQMVTAIIGASKEVEVSHADTLAKTYQTFWTAADSDKSNLMKIMWAAALASQIFVLFWSQWCVPMLYAYGYLPNWKAGTTAEWSYLLIGGLLGLGPMVLRSGPSSPGGLIGSLKALIGK